MTTTRRNGDESMQRTKLTMRMMMMAGVFQALLAPALADPQPGMPNVCEYQRKETVDVRVPSVRAFTATVRVYRPGCFLNTPACVTHERRTQYKTVHENRKETVTQSIYRCCPGWDSEITSNEPTEGDGEGETDGDGDAEQTGCLLQKTAKDEATSVTHEGRTYYLVEEKPLRDASTTAASPEGISPLQETPPPTLKSYHRLHEARKTTSREAGSSSTVRRHRSHHHQRNRRRHHGHEQRHRARHHKQSRDWALRTSLDPYVRAKTTYKYGNDSRHYRRRTHDPRNDVYDAYSYTIILTDRKDKSGRRPGGREGDLRAQASRAEEVVTNAPGMSFGE
ncbi:uncharacterized protein LOC122256034 [Penaeus japonicus]|uniref:uncharacterized protein LOC122256034 n=1 Tax=Penaeus japonicus TaxID=27405 RepID=UPI001C710AE2|nr:uncharacterized protein LOC122256034 [Penaeus japonicus]